MIEVFNPKISEQISNVFAKYAIITDDGHGWFTQGKRSFTFPPMYENEFNSIVEAKLMLLLDFLGIEHYQLSPGSIDTSLNKRGLTEHKIVADVMAKGKRPLGVSIHCDGWSDPYKPEEQNSANGFAVYYYGKGTNVSEAGKKLARYMADSILDYDAENGWDITPRHSEGICSANFYVLRETHSPWVLIENGFMTNNHDLNTLTNDKFRNDRAMAMLEGLYNFIKHK